MYVVGCDFGLSKSGIVVLDENYEIKTQTLLKVGSRGAARLYDIEQGFEQIIAPYHRNVPPMARKTNLVVFLEGYAYGAKYQRESLAELGGVMRRYFFLTGLDFWVIPPTSNKQFVTGTGRASKNYMKKKTKEKWGHSFKSDDVCDAHGLARLGMTCMLAMKHEEVLEDLSDEEYAVVDEILNNQEAYLNGNTAKRSSTRRNGKTKTEGQR